MDRMVTILGWRRTARALFLVAGAAALAGCDIAFTDLRAQSKDEWSRSYDLAAGGTVEVHNVNGSIEVESSGDGKLHVWAERVAKAPHEAAAKELLQKIEIVDQVTANRIRIETRGPRGLFGTAQTYVSYRVAVPEGASVKVTNTNGRITVRDVTGAVEARTTNGGVAGHGLKGRIDASTTNGGIDIAADAVAAEGITLETTNGGVSLAIPSSTKADISASVTNGGIDSGGLAIERLAESSRRRLEGRLNGGGAKIRLETTNGGIRITQGRS
jgi:DUF4097 and DUF4098 domain-containing protein YvlB